MPYGQLLIADATVSQRNQRSTVKTAKSKTVTRNSCTVQGFQAVISFTDCSCIELYYFLPHNASAIYAVVVCLCVYGSVYHTWVLYQNG